MKPALPVPIFKDNYVWLMPLSNKDNQVAIVDPGSADPVIDILNKLSLEPAAILVTHHHYDHIDGIQRLLSHYDIPVYGPSKEQIPSITNPLNDGDTIRLSEDLSFTTIDVPGHTNGHIAYYTPGILFCGDTLFAGGCGRLFEGTAKQLYQSLQKLAALPDDTHFYCAHEYTLSNLEFAIQVEPNNKDLQQRLITTKQLRNTGKITLPSNLVIEKLTNPFLRCHLPSITQAAEKFSGKALINPEDVFAVIRYWKDTF